MSLRSREILHGSAKGFRDEHANVNLHSAAEFETDFVATFDQHISDAGKRDNAVHQGIEPLICTAWAGNEEVEVAYGFASAPQGTGRCDLFDAWNISQKFGQAIGDLFCLIEMKAVGDAAI